MHYITVCKIAQTKNIFYLDFCGRSFGGLTVHFFAFFRATESAIATACFCGFPSRISVRIFCDIALFEHPFINGIFLFLLFFIKNAPSARLDYQAFFAAGFFAVVFFAGAFFAAGFFISHIFSLLCGHASTVILPKTKYENNRTRCNLVNYLQMRK